MATDPLKIPCPYCHSAPGQSCRAYCLIYGRKRIVDTNPCPERVEAAQREQEASK